MEKVTVNGVDLAYEITGDGEPVLLIHGACVADAMRPLARRLDGFRVITYHRRGYGASDGGPTPDVAAHAADARALLEALDAVPAHVIGHSFGGSTALELVSATPDVARSLVLLEAATPGPTPSAEAVGAALGAVVAPALEGRLDEATDRFLHMVLGASWQTDVARSLSSDAIAQTFADADDAMGGDLMALQTWSLADDRAARITCPALVVLGGATDDTVMRGLKELGIDAPEGVRAFGEMIDVQARWLPQARVVTLPAVHHGLQMHDTDAVAGAVVAFLAEQRSAVAT